MAIQGFDSNNDNLLKMQLNKVLDKFKKEVFSEEKQEERVIPNFQPEDNTVVLEESSDVLAIYSQGAILIHRAKENPATNNEINDVSSAEGTEAVTEEATKSGNDVYDENGSGNDDFGNNAYDEYGFDEDGNHKDTGTEYDLYGFNADGIHKETGTRYDPEGYNIDGYNMRGYNRSGYDSDGFYENGIHKDTGTEYNPYGFNADGIHKETGTFFDPEGYDIDGKDETGYYRDGYDERGYDRFGYDKDGYDEKGYDRLGYDRDGYDERGYDITGFNEDGYDEEGYNRAGYNKDGYDRDGNTIDDYNNMKNGNDVKVEYANEEEQKKAAENNGEIDGASCTADGSGSDNSTMPELTDEQQHVVDQYNNGYYMHDGNFDYMSFYNDMSSVGFGDDIAVYTGSEIASLWAALNNGSNIDDLFNAYGSGIHEGNDNSFFDNPWGNDVWGNSGGGDLSAYWDAVDAMAKAENEKDERDRYVDVDDQDS